jgi:hypothetical protein
MQKRVANGAIGASTLRNQGPAGVIKTAREYLALLNLRVFRKVNTEEQFERKLDKYTVNLMKRFPKGARTNWGAARKAMNVFLEEIFYNRFLSKEYKLYKLGPFLEVPLDSYVIKSLVKEFGRSIKPRWKGIKKLNPKTSRIFQDVAKTVAKGKGILRVYLDLKYWRGET